MTQEELEKIFKKEFEKDEFSKNFFRGFISILRMLL